MEWTHFFKKSDQIEPDFDNPMQYESYGHEAHDSEDPTEPVPVLWIQDGGQIKTMPALPGYNHFFFYKDSLEEVKAGTRDVALNVFHVWRGRFDFKDKLITADIAEESVKEDAPAQVPSSELRRQLIEKYIEESGGERPIQINSYVGGIHTDVLEVGDFAQDILQEAVPISETREPIEDRRHTLISSKVASKEDYIKEQHVDSITAKDRYGSDKYEINIDLSETHLGYSVSFYLYNFQVGVAGYLQYWHFKHGEEALARDTFGQIKKASDLLLKDIDYNNPPMAVIIPMYKSSLHLIDVEHKEKSGIDSYNRYIEGVEKAPDWRSTLYGPRYPKYKTETMSENWVSKNTDDKTREVETTGTSRDKTYKFKYAQERKEKHILSQFHMPQGPIKRSPDHITRHDAMDLLRQVIREMPPGQGQRYWNQIAVRLKALIPPEQHREMLRYLNGQYLQRQGSIQNNWNIHF